MIGISSVGFSPVGPVHGRAAYIGSSPEIPCGKSRGEDFVVREDTAEAGLLLQCRLRALTRMQENCAELGGDGVIDVRLSVRHVNAQVEFTALGTAVRADGGVRALWPFTTHMGDHEFANLITSGWVPGGVVVGVGVGRCHSGPISIALAERREQTQLMASTMRFARRYLRDDARRFGPDGVVVGEMTARHHYRKCSSYEHQQDLVAEVVVIGTAIAQFRVADRPLLTVMPLNRGGAR